MIAAIEPPKAQTFPPAEPLPPEIYVNTGTELAAVVLSFNGVQHRAMIEISKGRVRPEDVAVMLRRLAERVEA